MYYFFSVFVHAWIKQFNSVMQQPRRPFSEHTHRDTLRMLGCSHTHADTYLSNSLPGGKPHTLFTERKRNRAKVEAKARRGRGSDWGWERQRGMSEEKIKRKVQRKREHEQNKREEKRARGPRTEPLQTVLMYVGWVSGYTCPFNPSISGAPALSILSGSSFIPASQGLISPFRALHAPYIFGVLPKLEIGAL